MLWLLFSAIWTHKGKRLGKVSGDVTRFYLSPVSGLLFAKSGFKPLPVM